MSLNYIDDVVLPAVKGNPGQWVSINEMRKHCVEIYELNCTNTQLKKAIDDELRAYFNTYQIEERPPTTGSVGGYEYRCKRADMLDDAISGLKRKQPVGPEDGAAVEDADDDKENGGPPPWTTEELILLVKAYYKHKTHIGNSKANWSVVLNDNDFKALHGRSANSLYQRFRKLEEKKEIDSFRGMYNSCKKPKTARTELTDFADVACDVAGAEESAENELRTVLEKLSQPIEVRMREKIVEVIQKYCTLVISKIDAANAGATDTESNAFFTTCLLAHARDVLKHSEIEILNSFEIPLKLKGTDMNGIVDLNKQVIERNVCTAKFRKLRAVLPTLPELMRDWIKRHLSKCLEGVIPPHEEGQLGSSQLSKHEAAVLGMEMEIKERARKEMAVRIDECLQGVVFVDPTTNAPSPSVSTTRLIETRYMTSEVAKLVKQVVKVRTSASPAGPSNTVSILDKIKADMSSNAFKQMATALEKGEATLPSMIMNEVKKALLAVLGGVGAH